MKILNVFKKKSNAEKVTDENEVPSKEQKHFAEAVIKIIAPTVEQYGFTLHKTEIKKYSTNITWQKGKQFVKLSATTYPTDYPYYYNLVLGEATNDKFFETDWNSIALWKFKNHGISKHKSHEYSFPNENQVKTSIHTANKELEKYASDFLKGNLDLYHKLLNEQNSNK